MELEMREGEMPEGDASVPDYVLAFERGRVSSTTIQSMKKRQLRNFYAKQNALIDLFRANSMIDSHGEDEKPLNSPVQEEVEEECGGKSKDDRLSNLAMVISFGLNVALLLLKIWVVLASGSIAMLASAADSLLDNVSGVVLYYTERVAHNPFDQYQYPEGRGRIEPVGIIIFATIMFMSSLQILIESIKHFVEGWVTPPPPSPNTC